MRRMTITTLLTAGMLLIGSLPALAAQPVRFTEAFALEDLPCGGGISYDITMTGDAILRVSGTTETIHWLWRGEVVASDGTMLRVHHAFTESYDSATDTWTSVGKGFSTSVDGSPVQQVYAGRLVESSDGVVAAGRHPDGPFDPHLETCALIAAAS